MRVATLVGIPYLMVFRPASIDPGNPNTEFAADHDSAARMAFALGRPVLVTTGSRQVASHVKESRRTEVPCVVRVLDDTTTRAACKSLELAYRQIVVGRGPYSVETNRQQIRHLGIGVLVTKDSGLAGGTAKNWLRQGPKAAD